MRFLIITTATVTMQEQWSVEAASEDEAREQFFDRPDSLEFIAEQSLGDERDRNIESVAPFPEAGA